LKPLLAERDLDVDVLKDLASKGGQITIACDAAQQSVVLMNPSGVCEAAFRADAKKLLGDDALETRTLAAEGLVRLGVDDPRMNAVRNAIGAESWNPRLLPSEASRHSTSSLRRRWAAGLLGRLAKDQGAMGATPPRTTQTNRWQGSCHCSEISFG